MNLPNWLKDLSEDARRDYFKQHPNSKYNPHKKVSKTGEVKRPPVKTKKHPTQTTKFKKWFGASKVKNEDGSPKVVYHGTPFADKIVKFSSNPKIKGVDQLGSGFYFTTSPNDASGYAKDRKDHEHYGVSKDQDTPAPGVIPVYLAIKKPIRLTATQNLTDVQLKLSTSDIIRAIKRSHKIHGYDESPLWNYFDIGSEPITDSKLREIAEGYLDSPFTLENDFFSGHEDKFRNFINANTGYDGVVQEKADGVTHYVAWFPTQVKSAIGNVGDFSRDAEEITAKITELTTCEKAAF